MTDNTFAAKMEHFIFGHRRLLIGAFVLVSIAMAVIVARGLRIDASFTKQLPLQHEYMQTFVKHQAEFGGANRVLVALIARVVRRAADGRRHPGRRALAGEGDDPVGGERQIGRAHL